MHLHIYTFPETHIVNIEIIRDYLTVFWLSPEVSTRDPNISLKVHTEGDSRNPVK